MLLTLDQQLEKRAQLAGLGAAEVQQLVKRAQETRALEAIRQVQEEINALLLAAGKTQEEFLAQRIQGLTLGEKEKQQELDKLALLKQRTAYAEALQRLNRLSAALRHASGRDCWRRSGGPLAGGTRRTAHAGGNPWRLCP